MASSSSASLGAASASSSGGGGGVAHKRSRGTIVVDTAREGEASTSGLAYQQSRKPRWGPRLDENEATYLPATPPPEPPQDTQPAAAALVGLWAAITTEEDVEMTATADGGTATTATTAGKSASSTSHPFAWFLPLLPYVELQADSVKQRAGTVAIFSALTKPRLTYVTPQALTYIMMLQNQLAHHSLVTAVLRNWPVTFHSAAEAVDAAVHLQLDEIRCRLPSWTPAPPNYTRTFEQDLDAAQDVVVADDLYKLASLALPAALCDRWLTDLHQVFPGWSITLNDKARSQLLALVEVVTRHLFGITFSGIGNLLTFHLWDCLQFSLQSPARLVATRITSLLPLCALCLHVLRVPFALRPPATVREKTRHHPFPLETPFQQALAADAPESGLSSLMAQNSVAWYSNREQYQHYAKLYAIGMLSTPAHTGPPPIRPLAYYGIHPYRRHVYSIVVTDRDANEWPLLLEIGEPAGVVRDARSGAVWARIVSEPVTHGQALAALVFSGGFDEAFAGFVAHDSSPWEREGVEHSQLVAASSSSSAMVEVAVTPESRAPATELTPELLNNWIPQLASLSERYPKETRAVITKAWSERDMTASEDGETPPSSPRTSSTFVSASSVQIQPLSGAFRASTVGLLDRASGRYYQPGHQSYSPTSPSYSPTTPPSAAALDWSPPTGPWIPHGGSPPSIMSYAPTYLPALSWTPNDLTHAPYVPEVPYTPTAPYVPHPAPYQLSGLYPPNIPPTSSPPHPTPPPPHGSLFRLRSELHLRVAGVEQHVRQALAARDQAFRLAEMQLQRSLMEARQLTTNMQDEVNAARRNSAVRLEVEQAVISALRLYQAGAQRGPPPAAAWTANHPPAARIAFTQAVLDEHWPSTLPRLPHDLLAIIGQYAPTQLPLLLPQQD